MIDYFDIWYVQGVNELSPFPEFFAIKELAERYARVHFPDETEERRYSRIFSRKVWRKG